MSKVIKWGLRILVALTIVAYDVIVYVTGWISYSGNIVAWVCTASVTGFFLGIMLEMSLQDSKGK